MRRRELLTGALAGAFHSLVGGKPGAMAGTPTPEEANRRMVELRQKAIAAFPFERIEVLGNEALTTWERLKAGGRGCPVVLGNDDAVVTLMDVFDDPRPGRTAAEMLAAADRIRHPDDLVAHRDHEKAESREYLKKALEQSPDDPLLKMMSREPRPPELGEWPTEPAPSPGLSVAIDIVSGAPHQKVHIALIPTDDWTTIPAHLRWGAWNGCPPPEYHVVALRSWRDRFGAELVGLSSDTMNLRVTRQPQTRSEALELAQEQYVYCSDIVDQGVGTLSALAANSMASEWWYFWWD
jgi:hypothetical protein